MNRIAATHVLAEGPPGTSEPAASGSAHPDLVSSGIGVSDRVLGPAGSDHRVVVA